MKNVLIFPFLTNGKEIYNCLKNRHEYNVIIGHSEELPFKYVYIPQLNNTDNIIEYINIMNNIIIDNNIDYIFITHDKTLAILSQYNNLLKAKLVHPDSYFCQLAYNKLRTYNELQKTIPQFIPIVYNYTTISEIDLPIYVKPINGAGSRDNHIIYNIHDLSLYSINNYVLCEYLPGEEFTIDCFSKNGELLYYNIRTREKVKAGISNKSRTSNKHNKNIEYIAKEISHKYCISGLWFFQVKEDKSGCIKLLEVCARASGTICANLALGVNLPLLALYELENKNEKIIVMKSFNEGKVDRFLYNHYYLNLNYENVYVDFDDTLIINGRVNHELIGFLYNEKYNKNKKLYLITKHNKNNLRYLLDKYNLEGLFNDIYWLKNCEEKVSYIKDNSIFIDDSFKERYKITCKTKYKNIFTFDVNIDVLNSI